jgi:hypothetical protein
MMGQLLDIVGQAIQLPLPIHLGATPQGEASSRLLWRRLPDTGATVAKRRAIIWRPSSVSLFAFIRSV